MATWSKETVVSFIELYKSKECLWKIKSKEYRNRFLREAAYDELIAFCKTLGHNANKDFVTKKINNLRTSFKKELKKQERSKRSGAEVDEIYEPRLWYFQELMFLRDQEVPRLGSSSFLSEGSTRSSQENSPPECEVDMVILSFYGYAVLTIFFLTPCFFSLSCIYILSIYL